MDGQGRLRVGFSLFSMTPRLLTGTASYARGIMGELSRPGSPIEALVLVNRLMAEEVATWSEPAPSVLRLSGIPIRDTPAWRLALVGQALMLPMTRQLPRDLDLMHYPLTLPVPRTSLPVVLTLHDVQHHDLPHFFSRRQHVWRRRTYDAPARAATLVIADSEHAKLRIVECVGVPADRIEVIALGIDHKLFKPSGPGDTAALGGLDVPRDFLLYPGGLWRHKNHQTLVDALALLEDDVSLLLTGPTFGVLGELMEHATRRGVAARVRHLGFVTSEQLAALYRRARVLVFPSLYEGFGAPPLEAMACGCPVAASGEGALAETCASAAATFDARSAESIASVVGPLLTDQRLRDELRSRGLRRASGFTWRAAADRHVAAYARALELAG